MVKKEVVNEKLKPVRSLFFWFGLICFILFVFFLVWGIASESVPNLNAGFIFLFLAIALIIISFVK